ncbi:MAG: ferrochelatase [Anaerolineae bacterium]|nr:MAG: ferrochelatase [Anaerolineae bacterium]
MTTVSTANPIGVLLANVGTPEAPTAAAVRRYLAEFLSDPRIVDYPAWLWKPFLFGVLLRFRPRRSARLYQRVWTDRGSPLALGMKAIQQGLWERLEQFHPQRYQVAIGMRYGVPHIRQALDEFLNAGIERIFVLPLFPQYSGTTTGSVYDAVFAALAGRRTIPELRTVNHYYDHPGYLDSIAASIRANWQAGPPDKLVISFHGIPARYERSGDPYRAQCVTTAEQVASRLGLPDSAWVMTFQSKFGPERWLEPATDSTLSELGKAGAHSVDVVCPGFAVDCLETIDEIGHEGRLSFTQSGGKVYRYLPALNAAVPQIDLLQDIVNKNTMDWLGQQP